MDINKKIKTGSDFSGVGALDQAFKRLGIIQDKKFACDWDKYARQTYIENYGEPPYFPENVYDREIPEEPLDVYMSTPPCQTFSIAGKGDGEDDERGVLFYNSHNFIQVNKPRYFIFENVKGLILDDKVNKTDDMGRTFRKWLDYLGGKSVNGDVSLFPHEKSVPYHIYWFILDSEEYNIPQKRERVFIVGIRDDKDNHFRIPKKMKMVKKLKDCLEDNVDEKYFIPIERCKKLIKKENGVIRVKSATLRGFETAKIYDCIALSYPTSKTKRGRVGHGVSNTLTCHDVQTVVVPISTPGRTEKKQNGVRFKFNNEVFYTVTTQDQHGILLAEVDEKDRKNVVGFGIRYLTPRESFNIMDFPSSFKIPVSNTQAYKQCGNSVPVGLLVAILKQLKFE